jgi:hypothetical protein
MSPLVKILIGVVIVFVVFGAFAAAAVIYIGHRAREGGGDGANAYLNSAESREELRRIDGAAHCCRSGCRSGRQNGYRRVESTTGDPGCTYSVAAIRRT